MEVVTSCVKTTWLKKNCKPKVIGSRLLFLSKSLFNSWDDIVLTGVIMNPANDIDFVLLENNSFLKSQRQMKGCIIMVYI